MKKRYILAAVTFTGMTALTGIAASTAAQAAPGLGADCAIIGPIANGAIGQLAPLQSEPPAQAQAGLTRYAASIRAQEGKLATPQGKADVEAFASVVQSAHTQADGPHIVDALNKLHTDCP